MDIEKGLYKHHKGQHYNVIGLARHSETGEPLVVYTALYETKHGHNSLWVRPYSMFTEEVKIEGQMVARFQKVEE